MSHNPIYETAFQGRGQAVNWVGGLPLVVKMVTLYVSHWASDCCGWIRTRSGVLDFCGPPRPRGMGRPRACDTRRRNASSPITQSPRRTTCSRRSSPSKKPRHYSCRSCGPDADAWCSALSVTSGFATPVASTLVIGEDRFPILAPVHQVKASFLRPLQRTRHTWHDTLSSLNVTAITRRALQVGDRVRCKLTC